MKSLRTFSAVRDRAFLATLLIITMASSAVAQSTPPATNDNRGMQQPKTIAPPSQGWMWWDDNSGREMNIPDARMQELRTVDERYRKDYDALGTSPWTNGEYQALTERRNADIKNVLTPEQYQQWTSRTTHPRTPSATPAVTPNGNIKPSTPAPTR